MFVQLGQDFLDQLHFFLHHRLDNEAPVVAEEEETATGAGGFPCFEDLVSVRSRVQRSVNLLEVDVVDGSHTLEYARSIRCNRGA